LGLENDLRRVAREKKVKLRPSRTNRNRDAYYPQITEKIRHDAAMMAEHYELFYCLETSIRDLIRAWLMEADKENWWDRFVVQFIRDNAAANKKKETESGVTPRSDDWLSYTNCGELGQIIANNWDLFSDMFSDPKAVRDTITRLSGRRLHDGWSKTGVSFPTGRSNSRCDAFRRRISRAVLRCVRVSGLICIFFVKCEAGEASHQKDEPGSDQKMRQFHNGPLGFTTAATIATSD